MRANEEREAERLKLGDDDGKPKEGGVPQEVGNANPIADFVAMCNDRNIDRVSTAIH